MNSTPAKPEDFFSIATVHIRSWQAAYAEILDPEYLASLSIESRAARWESILRANTSKALISWQGTEVSGFVNFGKCRDAQAPEDRGEIYALYVSPATWRRGIGRELLTQAISELKALGFQSVSLWVFTKNQRAINFYESFGFQSLPGSGKVLEIGGRQVEEVTYVRHDASQETHPN